MSAISGGGCRTTSVAPSADADADANADAGCSGGESFALRVLGDDMAPEFNHGDILIIEPDGALVDGSFVLARAGDGWIFRQLCRCGNGWVLHALNASRSDLPDLPLADLGAVHGVVIQKAVPGRRKLTRHYVNPPRAAVAHDPSAATSKGPATAPAEALAPELPRRPLVDP